MINYIYQLVSPQIFSVKYSDVSNQNVIVRPKYMSICHADQRYYLGKRDLKILRKKLPMALIHECCGEVLHDPSGTYKIGQKVVLIPNVPPEVAKKDIYENYGKGSKFLSSGYDGFMREIVDINVDRVVPFENIENKIACICEFVSVGVHAINRLKINSHCHKDTIGIWGDGSLAYVVATALSYKFPESKIIVVGRDERKLSQFSFVYRTYLSDNIPKDLEIDHAFECAGGEGSYYAIDDIIKYINPQGTVMLMGVSENKVGINTRDVLEKGLTLIGSSRSGRQDFIEAVNIMEKSEFQNRLRTIIFEDSPVENIKDIHRVFANDLNTQFKTVFKWNV